MENDYNNPIKESEFNFLQYSDDGHCKRLRFTYKGQYFEQKYNYGKTWGFKFITVFENEMCFNNPLGTTGSKTIYSTTKQQDCTDLGSFIEYSLSKIDYKKLVTLSYFNA